MTILEKIEIELEKLGVGTVEKGFKHIELYEETQEIIFNKNSSKYLLILNKLKNAQKN